MSTPACIDPNPVPDRPRASRLLQFLVAMTLCTLAGSAFADCSRPSISTYKWCSSLDIPIWWGEGLGAICGGSSQEGTDCLRWRGAILAAVQEFNPNAVVELETAPWLEVAGAWDGSPTGIVFRLGHLGLIECTGGEVDSKLGKMEPHFVTGTGGPLRPLQYAEITFNLDVPWNDPGAPGSGSFNRLAVVRHELMHALGVGHASNGICLMNKTLPCGGTATLDESAWASLRCLYGDPWGSCSGLYGIDAGTVAAATVNFWIAGCGCNAGGCTAAKAAQPAALSYELAISESGGPYEVFATLQDGDLTDHQYSHEFAQSYQSAMVRLRVLDGASLVDEVYTLAPITIETTATAAPPVVAPQPPFRLASAPNPFAAGTMISFALDHAQEVQVIVYDLAGHRVATVHSGILGDGPHEIAWNGRADNGRPAASGIYNCIVRTPGGAVSRTLAKLR